MFCWCEWGITQTSLIIPDADKQVIDTVLEISLLIN